MSTLFNDDLSNEMVISNGTGRYSRIIRR